MRVYHYIFYALSISEAVIGLPDDNQGEAAVKLNKLSLYGTGY